ncbi:MAG: preprotein translocase subunit SecA [Candidatus Dojkabacteria bacterium]|nr:preprotein translocase subunit SecA [Candidatus Dojkabacteria bacterium]MDQ7020757.1 preprotein translocase subunit SecA [Candidatus Dojkabacteria bacterium]
MINPFKVLFDSNDKQVKGTESVFKKIKALEEEMKEKSFEEFRERINEMKEEIRPLVDEISDDLKRSVRKIDDRKSLPKHEKVIQEKLMELLPEVFAMLNEVYRRKTGFAYHDIQLKAGIILAQGQRLIEQYTGEGKTRTFQLPLVLYSLVGRGAHLVTVNEYLTKVGAEYAGHMISELGVSIGIITPSGSYKFITDDKIEAYKSEEDVAKRKEQEIDIDKMTGINLIDCGKKDAYNCDITYGTNNEFGFDYLRDNMSWEVSRLNQRELYYCIIDEADSILIDEARTPLIISASPSDSNTEKYTRFATAVKNLEENVDYEVDHKQRSVTLTEGGINKVEANLGVDNIWEDYSMAFHLENALKAKALFFNGDQYMVKSGEVLIVDEFTGRVLSGRRYSEGLHQAIEAKEGVEIQKESRTYATVTFQNFFRLYKFLNGGSGTVMTEGEEFFKIYGLESVVIPTNKPRIRIDHSDRIYKTADSKWRAVANDIKEEHEKGRPVLVGTTSVENSEIISKYLDELGIEHEVLNAKFHEQESRIVSKAGRKGAVTVATNMAGRGTDIVIGGGKRGDKNWQELADLGGLHVIGTERHDARRIDNQLRGRTGRQGEPGSTRFYVSLEDKIMRVLGGELILKLMNLVRVPDDTPIEMGMISKQIEMAQKRVESLNFDSRKNVVDYDDVMNQHREIFYTRRRNILVSTEASMGKVLDNGEYVNLALPENKKLENKYSKKVEEAKNDVENIARDIINDEIDYFIEDNINSNDLKEEEVNKVLEKLYKIIPQSLLVVILDQSADQTEVFLKQLIKNGDKPALEESLNKIYDFKRKEFGEDFYNLMKALSIEEMDKKWVDHLEVMKGIREAVGLQGYAQRDPLTEYKNKAYDAFGNLISDTDSEIAQRLFKVAKAPTVQSNRVQNVQTNEDEVEDVLPGESERASRVMSQIEKQARNTQAGLRTNASEVNKTVKANGKEYGRNDKVSVKYSDGTEKKDVKYKKVQADVESGRAEIVG